MWSFQLEIHLPYFALIEGPPRQSVTQRPPWKWIDLSFLGLEMPGSGDRSRFGIYQGHFALAISGSNNRRWTAISFENDPFSERFEKDLEEELFSYDAIQEDLIVSGHVVDANKPVQDVRGYFLWILSGRSTQQLRFWDHLVLYLERSVDRYVRCCVSTLFLSQPSADNSADQSAFQYHVTRSRLQ